MGRSTSCLKIITCGSDSADKDDLEASESKGAGDKRGWSFRKRSARHRVLSNIVVSEAHSSGKQESAESDTLNFQPPANSTVPEKISVKQCTDEKPQLLIPVDSEPQLSTPVDSEPQLSTPVDSEPQLSTPADSEPQLSTPVDSEPQLSTPADSEPQLSTLVDSEPQLSTLVDSEPQFSAPVDSEPQLSTLVDSKVYETTVSIENESEDDVNLDESVIVVIQAAVRGFLAQRELFKLKNVIKLQAAVRGHLVRRHAVGTLRCVQAIVKIQTIVRARRARLSLEGSYREKESDGKHEKDNQNSNTLEKVNSGTKGNVTSYTSIEKLLSNRFARQLMESTPKTKPINIKCDPSKPNSAWNWLERWMSVSSVKPTPKLELMTEQTEREKNENCASPVETQTPFEFSCEPADSKSSISETVVRSESEENLITYDAGNFEFQAPGLTYSVRENLEQPQSENSSTSDAKETPIDINFPPNQTMQSDANSQSELNSLPHKPEIENEQPKRSMKRNASELLETEGKKFVFGSRKLSNPSFVAAQTKFEELSSTANSDKSISSSYQDVGVESNIDTVSSGADTVIRAKEFGIAENSVPHISRGQVGGSECGTELSVTSTLDSPDISEIGNMELEHEAKVSEEETCDPNSRKSVEVEAKDASTIPMSNLSYSVSDQPDKYDDANCKSETVDSQQVEPKPEGGVPDLQRGPDSETVHQAYRLSPEASPRSHLTVPESQGTPSSQVSVKAKKNKTDESGSNQKHSSLSASKRSPLNRNHDSGARSSMEQLPKEQKNGKRHNSFGSPRPDHVDQEPRDSSSSSSLPHFMQATESARAKVNANNSPRSSPDLHDRDIYIKKRHSLPGANGRQGSPRIERSMSQAQQGTKGNGSQPHERKWQR